MCKSGEICLAGTQGCEHVGRTTDRQEDSEYRYRWSGRLEGLRGSGGNEVVVTSCFLFFKDV